MAICAVSGTVQNADGSPAVGVAIAFFGRVPTGVGTVTLDDALVTEITDSGGAFTVDLIQGALVRVRCASLGLDELTVTVPTASTGNLQTMIAQATANPDPANPFALESDLLAEVARAEAAETDIAGDLDDETNAREAADTMLATGITNEATTRAAADTALGNRVTTLETAGYQTSAQVGAAISGALASYSTTSAMNTAISTAISGEVTARNAAISAAITALVAQLLTQLRTQDFAGIVGGIEIVSVKPYPWSADPNVLQGIRIDALIGGTSVALLPAANGVLYPWNPVDGTSGEYRADRFSNGTGTFSIDIIGNAKFGTLKVGGGQVAVSESPANVMQFTLPDLSTLIVTRHKSVALQGSAPASSSDPGITGEVRADASYIYRYDGTQWKRAPLTYATF